MPLNRPTLAELREAIEEYQQQPAEHEKAHAFYLKVMANIEAIMDREEQHSESYADKEAAQLVGLLDLVGRQHSGDLKADNAALCEVIEQGAYDQADKLGSLVDSLQQLSEQKLQIDNPRYILK